MQQPKTKVVYRTSAKLNRRMSEALGAVCSHFAMLEWNVDRTIWALTGKDRKQGRLLTQHLLNDARIKQLRKEANNRFGNTHASALFYGVVADDLKILCRRRNLYVHGLWSKGKTPGTRRKQYVLSYFKNPDGYSKEVSIGELQAFVRVVRTAKIALAQAAIQHIGSMLP